MKKSLVIVKIEPKKSKKGDTYWVANSFQGETFSIWDGVVADNVLRNLHEECEFEVEEKNGFKNIREVFNNGIEKTPVKPFEEKKEVVVESPKVTEIINKTYRPNSRTFGKGDNQIKIYFDDADDLYIQIKKLIDLRLFPEDVNLDLLK